MSVGMIIGCRLCLCTDPRKSFTFLDFNQHQKSVDMESLTVASSSGGKSLMVKKVANLEVDFSKLEIFPNHICETCWQEVERLDQFQKMAQMNEKFIMQCQEDIKTVGLLNAKEMFDARSYSQSPDVFTEENSLERETLQKTEEDQVVEENKVDFQEIGGDEDNETNETLEDCFDKVENVSKCNLCRKQFSSTKVRLRHEKDVHSTTCTVCNICKINVKHMKYHMQTKHPEIYQASTRGVCTLCNQECDNLRKHEQNYHTDVDSINCPICFKVFLKPRSGKLKAIVKQHIKLSHDLENIRKPCPLCEKMYADVNFHMKSTHSTEKAKCTFENCKKVCKNKIRLKQHMRKIHSDRKPKVCPQCGETFRCSRFFVSVFVLTNII